MSHHRLNYATKIRERGFRLTPQREIILDAVCEGRGHTTFDEIYTRVQAKAPAINRATVYRTLDFLREMRLVVEADLGGGRKVYEIAGETPHHHLVCRACGRVEEFDQEMMESLFTRIERERQFEVDMDHLVLFGLCQECCNQKTQEAKIGY
jgi:Fur family ferric uptake transcriptional regulator